MYFMTYDDTRCKEAKKMRSDTMYSLALTESNYMLI